MKKVLVLLIGSTALFTSCGLKEIKGNTSNDSTVIEPIAVIADSVILDSIVYGFEIDSVN